jgi:hypothetical protein
MNNYEIDLRKKGGERDCLLVIACPKDQAAIVLAKSIFRVNRKRTERVVVWRGDEVIFEESKRERLN